MKWMGWTLIIELMNMNLLCINLDGTVDGLFWLERKIWRHIDLQNKQKNMVSILENLAIKIFQKFFTIAWLIFGLFLVMQKLILVMQNFFWGMQIF
jgi:hypothetical protein